MPKRSLIRRALLALGAVLLLLALTGLLLVRLADSQPVGTGERRVSPDGRFQASVMSFSARNFWSGAAREWFEFTVQGPGLDHHMTTTPIPGPYFGSRSSHRVIFWDAGSGAVRFVFPTMTFQIDITPARPASDTASGP